MERVTFEEYEAAKAAVLYGKEYEEKSSMENISGSRYNGNQRF